MRIWLDDVRTAPIGWEWHKTATSVMVALGYDLDTGALNITDISLDHDLGENVASGYDVVKCIEEMVVEKGYIPPTMTIHSQNPVGRENMQRAIDAIMKRQYDKDCENKES